jgi:GTP-binding protein
MTFTVAIVGRPNVGKSTLFNRLTGKRHALVDDMPGVTRDRRAGDASLGGMPFTVVDTAGLEDADEGTLQARMTEQSRQAIRDSDVALLVIDGRAGVTPMDKYFAQSLRKTGTPVILLVNKAEGGKARTAIAEAHGLGLGEPVAISAEHGEGLAELYDALAPYDKSVEGEDDAPVETIDTPMQIAIVGRPNVGKSTLMNKILGEERVLTGPEAGITRDSITIDYVFKGKKLKLIDTAGMRRKANVQAKVEKLAVADTLRAIQYAHVVVLVIDAEQPLEKQEATIAALVEQEGRAMVLAVNKWDAVPDKPAYEKAIKARLAMILPQVKGVPMVPISGLKGTGIGQLLTACFSVYALWNKEIGTGELNRWLEAAIEQHTPPMVHTRRIKIRYMTQKSARPPSFILFSNTSEIPESYMRYLVNSMRERFALPGIPLRVRIRKNKNPYAEGQE